MIIKTFKVLRNNWKKSVFLSGVVYYAGNYFHTSYKINNLMKEYCQKALIYGDDGLNFASQPKHFTVILNPKSKNNKSKKYFNDYVEPILHCAGIKVSLIETESQGQAVKLMEIMSNTDAVLIAGGSGTIQEVLTGFFRREDANEITKNLPIGFLPLGTTNKTFFKIYNFENESSEPSRLKEVKTIAESTLKIVQNNRKNLNVLRIHDVDNNKTVFSLNNLEFGVFSELSRQFSKYWYLGDFLSKNFVFLKSTLFKNLNKFEISPIFEVEYTEKCSGCSNCYDEFVNTDVLIAKQRSKSWFSGFRSIDQRKKDQQKISFENNLKSKTNEECGKWKKLEFNNLFNVLVENKIINETPEINLNIFKNSPSMTKSVFFNYLKNHFQTEQDDNVSKFEIKKLKFNTSAFIKNDFKKSIEENKKTIEENIKSIEETIKLDEENKLLEKNENKIKLDEENKESMNENKDSKVDTQKVNECKINFFIDDENYEVKNIIEVSSLLNKLVTFK